MTLRAVLGLPLQELEMVAKGHWERERRKKRKITIYIYLFFFFAYLPSVWAPHPIGTMIEIFQDMRWLPRVPGRERKIEKKRKNSNNKFPLFFFAHPSSVWAPHPIGTSPPPKKNIYIYIFFLCWALPPKALFLPLFLCMLAYGRAFLCHIHLTSMACLWHVYGVPLQYLQIVNLCIWKSIPLAYPSYIYGMSVACLWCTFAISTNSIPMACLSCMSMTYLWDIYGIAAAYLSMIYLQIVNLWLSMAYLWHQSMIFLHIVYLWLAYGRSIVCRWQTCGTSGKLLWHTYCTCGMS